MIRLATLFVFVLSTAPLHAANAHFDPATGFKPAQRSLSDVFLQLAASLEHYGSPLPYLRHIVGEHGRIEAKYEKAHGKKPSSTRAKSIDAAYLAKFEENWNLLAPVLDLEQRTKTIGKTMREGIEGKSGKGTIAVNLLNLHQLRIYNDMFSKKARVRTIGSKELRIELGKLRKPGSAWTLRDTVEVEQKIDPKEQAQYLDLLKKKRFTERDFAAIERFYKTTFDKLSKNGQAELSRRTWSGTRRGGEGENEHRPRLEAEAATRAIEGEFGKLFAKVSEKLEPAAAKKVKRWIEAIATELVGVANSELEAAILESIEE